MNDRARGNAARVVHARFTTGRTHAAALEPHGCVADYDLESGRLTLYASTQMVHILRDALHTLNRIGLKHVREIVHQPGRRRDLDALEKKREPGCSQDGNESRRRRKTDQNRSKYLLSLDFMVWQVVYLADDSHPS